MKCCKVDLSVRGNTPDDDEFERKLQANITRARHSKATSHQTSEENATSEEDSTTSSEPEEEGRGHSILGTLKGSSLRRRHSRSPSGGDDEEAQGATTRRIRKKHRKN